MSSTEVLEYSIDVWIDNTRAFIEELNFQQTIWDLILRPWNSQPLKFSNYMVASHALRKSFSMPLHQNVKMAAIVGGLLYRKCLKYI